MTATATTRRIEVFRPGTFTPMQGAPITMTADDLRAIAAGYDYAASPAPLVVGHPKTEDMAYGWANSFSYDEASGRLVAECGDIPTDFSEAVKAKRWKRISLSLFSPGAPNNPKPGTWYPKHIGFLGATAPAVTGLAPVSFAADAGALVFEFGEDDDPADDASVGRALRNLLGTRRRASTDIPAWPVAWLDPAPGSATAPAFSAPPTPPSPPPLPEPPVTTTTPADPAADAAAAARAADLDRREQELNRRATEQAHTDNLAFAESLISEGRLLPASGDRVVALLDGLVAAAPAEVSFSEGAATRTLPAAQVVREILSAQPVVVSFGEMGGGGRGGAATATAEFSAPDSRPVDRGQLEKLGKVRAYQAQHPNTSFADAAKAVGV